MKRAFAVAAVLAGSLLAVGSSAAALKDASADVTVFIVVTGSGDPAGGSIVQAAGTQVPVTAVPKASVPQLAKTATKTTTTKAKAKPKAKVPACKKGQRSTKKKPCHK